MELIGDIVKRILTKAGRENVYYEGIVKNRWKHIVGDFGVSTLALVFELLIFFCRVKVHGSLTLLLSWCQEE